MLPYFGCAQETDQTAPSCLFYAESLAGSRTWGKGEIGGDGQEMSGVLKQSNRTSVSVPFQCFCQSMCLSLYLEDLDSAVRGAGRQASAVVVEDCVVLERMS
jgi:hypothetical protein